jgi:hypothetical protein
LENSGFLRFVVNRVGRSRENPLLFRLGGFAVCFLRGFA